MCCSKPTIAVISMQERYDNDKTEPHNHNKYLLLYKEADQHKVWADFRVPEVLHISCNTGTRALPGMSAHATLGLVHTY